jgi:ABC-2 type transport system ATP-binding protein
MDPTVEITGLRKRFGSTVAVDGLSFTVEPGRVTGFVGPNGAGKSTTMRMILGLDTPDAGRALVGGRPYRTLRAPLRHVGALLEASATHPGRRAVDHVTWLAHSNGISRRRVDEVLDLVGLGGGEHRRTRGFSLGMAQRLGIAVALLGDPATLLLDEPVNGLDPDGIRWVRGLLRSLAAEGRAVLVSSHLMSELEDTADHVVVIGRGRLLADARVDELLAASPDRGVTLRTPDHREALPLLAAAGGRAASNGDGRITVTGLEAGRIAALLGERGLRLEELTPGRASLEDAYLRLTHGAGEHTATPLRGPEPPAGDQPAGDQEDETWQS